jgi:hypothetical protein
MNNCVLLYHFEDQDSEKHFEKSINGEFWRHRVEENDGFKYFGFAAREEPAVVDKIGGILDPLAPAIGTKDYVALYFSRDEDPDKIKREMVLGHDSLIETKVEDVSFDSHRNSLTRLLDFDYVKDQPEPPERR